MEKSNKKELKAFLKEYFTLFAVIPILIGIALYVTIQDGQFYNISVIIGAAFFLVFYFISSLTYHVDKLIKQLEKEENK